MALFYPAAMGRSAALDSHPALVYSHPFMTEGKSYFVGLVQMAVSDDVEKNLQRAVQWVDQAAHDGAQVVCLPELFRSRYFCQHEDAEAFNLAETVPGPSTEAMAEAAKRNQVTVVVPLFEKRAAGLYHNSLVVVGPAGRSIGLSLPSPAMTRFVGSEVVNPGETTPT